MTDFFDLIYQRYDEFEDAAKLHSSYGDDEFIITLYPVIDE